MTFVVIVILLSIDSIAQSENGGVQIPTKVSIHTEYLGDNKSAWGFSDMLVNITINRLGHLIYIEEYYTEDSSEDPKFVTSRSYYNDNITDNDISLQIMRPFSRSGTYYSLVRGVVIFDNKRVYEKWIRSVNGAHLTYSDSEEDMVTKINENIDKFETRGNTLVANLPVIYKFTTRDLVIYEVGIISTGNERDVVLTVKHLKGIPILAKRFPGAVYKYIDISLDTYQIKKLSFRYKVENSWINDSDIPGENIKLFRWNKTDSKWYGLETKIISKDDNYTYYESETTNISQFAIAGLRDVVTIINGTNDFKPIIEAKQKDIEINHTNMEPNTFSIIELIKEIIATYIRPNST